MSSELKVWSMRGGLSTPPDNVVRVDRTTKWGNPYVIGIDGDLQEVIEQYSDWLLHSKEGVLLIEEARDELKGKDLVCWCVHNEPSTLDNAACHAQVLMHYANGPAITVPCPDCNSYNWQECDNPYCSEGRIAASHVDKA